MHHGAHFILVLTSSGFLESQLDSELKPYLYGVKYKVCHFKAMA